MNIRLTLSAITLSLLSSTTYAETRVVDLADYGIRPGNTSSYTRKINATLSRALSDMNANDTLTLRFSPGKYNFYPDKSTQRTLYISNHDQTNPKQIGLLIENATNLIIDGSGSEFIFHGQMIPIAAAGCSNLTIKNLSIDFEKPQIAQIEIIENDTINGFITYRPAEWVDYSIKGGTFTHKGLNWTQTPCVGIAFDKQTHHIVYNTSDIAVGVHNVTSLGKNLIKAPWRNPKLSPGTIVALRTYDRPTPGIFIDNCRDIAVTNTSIHYAEGMGLIVQNTHNIRLNKFNVCLKGDNDPRYFTTQADATHFSGCSGLIESTEGLYEAMMDDAINVHGTYLKVTERIDSTTLIGEYMHPQSYGFRWAAPGDTVNIVSSRTMDLATTGLIVAEIIPEDSNSDFGAKRFKVRFTQSIPSAIDPSAGSFGLENMTATPEVIFTGNVVRNNRARGALFSTPRRVICNDNTFDHTSGCAVLLCGDCNGWYETGACHDVTISNNRFINSLTNLFQFTNAVISIYPEIPDLKNQTGYFHSNITITGNHFETFDIPLLYAKSVDGLIFQGNTLTRNNDFLPLHWNKSQIWLERVNDTRIQAIE